MSDELHQPPPNPFEDPPASPAGAVLPAAIQSIVQHDTSGWLGVSLSLVTTLVVGAVAVYQAWQAGKAKAETLHQADVASEQLKEHQADVVKAQGADQLAQALNKVNDAEDHIKQLQDKAKQLTMDHDNAIAQIRTITSWNTFIVVRSNDQNQPTNPALPAGGGNTANPAVSSPS